MEIKGEIYRVSGYHIRQAGCSTEQELAFTIANGVTYARAAVEKGLDVDDFAPRMAFFFNGHNDFLHEIAKYRAARQIWAQIMKKEFNAKNEKSMMLRFHTQTGGSTLTAQQPHNNGATRTTIKDNSLSLSLSLSASL